MNIEDGISRNKYSNYSKENGNLNIKQNINYFTLEKDKEIHCHAIVRVVCFSCPNNPECQEE